MSFLRSIREYRDAFQVVRQERRGEIQPKVLITHPDLPISTFGHALDNIGVLDAPIVFIIQNFDAEGNSLFGWVTQMEIYQDQDWQLYSNQYGKPDSFYEISQDSVA